MFKKKVKSVSINLRFNYGCYNYNFIYYCHTCPHGLHGGVALFCFLSFFLGKSSKYCLQAVRPLSEKSLVHS